MRYTVVIEKGEPNYLEHTFRICPAACRSATRWKGLRSKSARRLNSISKGCGRMGSQFRGRRVGRSMSRLGMTLTQFMICSATPLDAVAADLSRSTKRGRRRAPIATGGARGQNDPRGLDCPGN